MSLSWPNGFALSPTPNATICESCPDRISGIFSTDQRSRTESISLICVHKPDRTKALPVGCIGCNVAQMNSVRFSISAGS